MQSSPPSANYLEAKPGAPQVLIATSHADYLCVKPAPGYKKMFAHTAEQADILREASFLSFCYAPML